MTGLVELTAPFLVKLARKTFDSWTESKEGKETLQNVASKISWSIATIFNWGKMNQAKSDIWKGIEIRQNALLAVLQKEAKEYSELPAKLVTYSSNLVEDRQTYAPALQVLPRYALNSIARKKLREDLADVKLVDETYFSPNLRESLFDNLLNAFDENMKQHSPAVAQASQRVDRWLASGTNWAILAFDPDYVWVKDKAKGHYILMRKPDGSLVNEESDAQLLAKLDEKSRVALGDRVKKLQLKLGLAKVQELSSWVQTFEYRTEKAGVIHTV